MDCYVDEHQNDHEAVMSFTGEEGDNYKSNSGPDGFQEDISTHRIHAPTRHYGFSNSPYAWRPTTMPEAPPNIEEDELYQSALRGQYIDPFEPESPGSGYNGGLAYSGSVSGSFSEKRGEAKKVCGQISKLLRDKNSPSKGSRMFQKRRKRSEKFAIIGYGTQPTEEDYTQRSESEDSASEELSRIDYGTSDDEISAYDKPGVNNALTTGESLNPSEQIIQKQLKNLAMDVSGMRGKGAKIFAKRQQRMENYIITDENRRNARRPSDQGDVSAIVDQPKESSRPEYFRPGSSIGIAAKSSWTKPPVVNRNMSGYSTDVEDDYRRPLKQQLNYFSDCEGPAPTRRDKPRRTRPANRRAWESEDEGEIFSYSQQPSEVRPTHQSKFNYSFSPDVSPVRSQPPQQEIAHEQPQAPMQHFRKVLPPGRAPIPRLPPMQHAYEQSAIGPERRASYEQKPPHPEQQTGARRTWTRVSFQPRAKKSVVPSSPNSVVDYPCERTHPATKSKPPSSVGYRTPSQSPQRPVGNPSQSYRTPSQSPQRPDTNLPQAHPKPVTTNQRQEPPKHPHSSPAKPQMALPLKPKQPAATPQVRAIPPPPTVQKSEENPSVSEKSEQKASAAVSLLEKPMKHEPSPADQYEASNVPTSQDAISCPTADDFVGVPDQDDDVPISRVSQFDFVEAPEEQVVVPPRVENSAITLGQTQAVTDAENGDTVTLTVKDTQKEESKAIDSPPCSPISVASYVSSNSPTFTSMLPSRCLSPPTRPYTPNGGSSSPRAIKIASRSKTAKPLTPVHGTIAADLATEQKETAPAAMEQFSPGNATPKQTPVAPPQQAPSFNQYPAVRTQVSSVAPPQIPDTEPVKGDKISACMKVLDPSKMLFQPKPQVQYQPSPTLDAILQSENESSYGSFITPPISYCPPNPSDIKSEVRSPPERVRNVNKPMRGRIGSGSSGQGQAPQPLGMIAGGMKGKGAKMFEKQQQRMQKYTKETSAEDFPGLQKGPSNGSPSPVMNGKFSYAHQNGRNMAGFSPDGKKIEPDTEVRSSMMQVMGEFQKGSKPGRAKRPSQTKKKGRDPLHYQQYLFYQPPSDADFVGAPTDPIEMSSRVVESDFVPSPNASMTSMATQDSEGSHLSGGMATSSSSSMTSQRSTGPPKTAPKPSKAIITRQLSKPTSPAPVVSISPTPDVQGFKPTPASPTPSNDESDYKFNGVSEDKNTKCIEDLILQERLSDDHRDSSHEQSASRQRVISLDVPNEKKPHSTPVTNGVQTSVTDKLFYRDGVPPPKHDEVPLSEPKPRLFHVSNNAVPRGGAAAHSLPASSKPEGFTVPKPKFSPKRSGIEVKMWKPGQ